jgi:hypothetical protein
MISASGESAARGQGAIQSKTKNAISQILGVDDGTIGNDLAAMGEPKEPKIRKFEPKGRPLKKDQPKDSKIRSESGPPPGWHTGVPSDEMIRMEADEGLIAIIWDKDRFRLLIWLPIITGALQVLAVILHR